MMALPGFMCGTASLGEIEHRVDVDLECQLPFLVGNIRDVVKCILMRRIVHEDVDAAEFVDSTLHQISGSAPRFRISPGARTTLHPSFSTSALTSCASLVLVQISDQKVRPLRGHMQSQRRDRCRCHHQ